MQVFNYLLTNLFIFHSNEKNDQVAKSKRVINVLEKKREGKLATGVKYILQIDYNCKTSFQHHWKESIV